MTAEAGRDSSRDDASSVTAAAVENSKENSSNISSEEEVQVPVIDLAGLANGDAATRGRIVREIMEACEKWGVCQIVNHGVPEQIFPELDKLARDFFALPQEVKERVNLDVGPNYQMEGYLRRMQPDPLFNSWRENLAQARTWSQTRAVIDRVWPNGNAPFVECLQRWLTTSEELALLLTEILAEGLGLESNFFSQQLGTDFESKRFHWRVNSYPPHQGTKNVTLGMSPHTDPNLLTLLSQDDVCGLQAKMGDRWVDVSPIPGALIVNIGNCLEAWSNGRLTSVEHRVVVSPSQQRISWVYLLTPELSMVLESPPQLIDHEHPQMFKAFTYEGLATNMYQKVGAARKSEDPQKMDSRTIFHDFALLSSQDETSNCS